MSLKNLPTKWNEFRVVAMVKEPVGLRGDLFLINLQTDLQWLDIVEESIWLIEKPKTLKQWTKDSLSDTEKLQEFEVTALREHKKGAVISLAGVSTREHTEKLQQALVLLPQENLLVEEEFYLDQLLDFELWDDTKCVGKIVGFSSNGAQDLLQVQVDQRVFEVPYVLSWVDEIDWNKNFIRMSLPDGIMDQY